MLRKIFRCKKEEVGDWEDFIMRSFVVYIA